MTEPLQRGVYRSLFDFSSKLDGANIKEKSWTHKKQKKAEIKCVIYKSSFNEWVDVNRTHWDKKAKETSVHPREYYFDTYSNVIDDDEILKNLDPYERIQLFEEFLENKYKIDRELFQRQVHDMITAVCAHLIVGDRWKFVGKDIVKQRGWEDIVKSLSLFAMAYRRAGKTSSCQMSASNLAILCPGINISMFANSQRIAIVMGQGVIKMIIEAGYGDMIYTKSKEIIVLRINNNPLSERTIFMSPGNPDVSNLFNLTINSFESVGTKSGYSYFLYVIGLVVCVCDEWEYSYIPPRVNRVIRSIRLLNKNHRIYNSVGSWRL